MNSSGGLFFANRGAHRAQSPLYWVFFSRSLPIPVSVFSPATPHIKAFEETPWDLNGPL